MNPTVPTRFPRLTVPIGLLALLLSGVAVPLPAQTLASARTSTRASSPHQVTAPTATRDLRSLLTDLEQTYGVRFNYRLNVVRDVRVVPASPSEFGGELATRLNQILTPAGLQCKALDARTFVIQRKISVPEAVPARFPEVPESSAAPAESRPVEIPVKGRVTSETGEGLPGVSVTLKGTTRGAVTAADGSFQLQVPDGSAVLVFSSVGYERQEVTVGNQTTLTIALRPDTRALDEVVVVGYGTQKQVNLTGSVGTVSAKQIQNRPITNLAQALTGTVAGVYANQLSGRPGQENVTLRILGTGTLNNADPLVLVDGVEASIANINANDVESISVLKDAAAAAIYGSRAANGVVLVTTKKGRNGKAAFAYNAYYGLTSPTDRLRTVTYTPDALELTNEYYTNVGQPAFYSPTLIQNWRDSASIAPHRWPTTDWMKELFRQGRITEHNLGMSGGTEGLLYNVSLTYLDNVGIVPTTRSQRYTARINLDGTINRRFKWGNNLSVIHELVGGSMNLTQDRNRAGLLVFLATPDIYPEYDGRYGGPSEGTNGLSTIGSLRNAVHKQFRLSILDVGYLQYELLKGLVAKSTVGIQYNQSDSDNFNRPVDSWNFRTNQIITPAGPFGSSISNTFDRRYQLTWINTLDYNTTIGKSHNLHLLAGSQTEYFRTKYFTVFGSQIFTDATPVIASATQATKPDGFSQDWAMQSFFGRVNYNFREKYLVEANLRADASSRFSPEFRRGYFPSFSAGWRITEEPFARPLTGVIDNLKLRASWGKLGNNAVDNYAYKTLYSNTVNYLFGGTIVTGVAPTRLSNPAIQWETTTVTDFGLDIDAFKNRLRIEADVFNRLTDGILVARNVPNYIGALGGPFVNLAEVENRGWSLLTSYQQKIGNVRFTLGGNLTQVTNQVNRLQGGVRTFTGDGNFVTQEGLPINSIFGYRSLGLFRSADDVGAAPTHVINNTNPRLNTSPGDIRYEDVDKDGRITPNDRTVIGNTIPKFTYGFNLNVQYKNFELAALFNGVADQQALLVGNYFMFDFEGRPALRFTEDWLNHWTPTTPDAPMPRLASGYTWNRLTSDFYVQDASFLRLKNVQLTYSLPQPLLAKLRLNTLRVYVNGQNLVTWSDLKGIDPERSPLSTSFDFPNVKMFTFGLNASF
jgi:TonB-linked SusC/RagA family outer membrane protein